MKRNLLYILLGALATFSSFAAHNTPLKSCIEKGLEQNFQIRMVRNDQKISDNNMTFGNAGYLPTLVLNAAVGGSESNTSQFPPDGSATIKTTGVSNQQLSSSVNLNWTIFEGFNIQANYSKLKEFQQMGELKTRMKIESYVADLSAEYYNFIQQNIRINNLRSAVRLSKERLRIVEARYNIGDLSRLDLQQARVYFNSDSSRLIRQHELLYATKVKINQLMGEEDLEQNINLADTLISFDALLNKEQLWEQTLQQNTYLQMATKEKNIKVLDLQSARSSNYPYLKLNAGYGYDLNRYEYAAYQRQDNLGFNYRLSVGYNIFDGMNRSRKQKNAQIAINNQVLAIEELTLSVKSDFSNLWMTYINNINLTKLEKENLVHATENYEIAIERYKLGDLAGIELREAQNSLLEAEERLVQSQYLTKLCEISLLEISGGIMAYLQ